MGLTRDKEAVGGFHQRDHGASGDQGVDGSGLEKQLADEQVVVALLEGEGVGLAKEAPWFDSAGAVLAARSLADQVDEERGVADTGALAYPPDFSEGLFAGGELEIGE